MPISPFDTSLEEIERIMGKPSVDEKLRSVCNEILIGAGTLLGIISADSLAEGIKVFSTGKMITELRWPRISEWIRKNYLDERSESEKIRDKYELLTFVNFLLVHIAIRETIILFFKDPSYVFLPNTNSEGVTFSEIFEKIRTQLTELKKSLNQEKNKSTSLSDTQTKLKQSLKQLESKAEEIDQLLQKQKIILTEHGYDINDYLTKIYTPFIEGITTICFQSLNEKYNSSQDFENDIRKLLFKKTKAQYLAYLLYLAEDFPEFKTWIDLNQREAILKLSKEQDAKLKDILSQITEFQSFKKVSTIGMEGLFEEHQSLVKDEISKLINKLDEDLWNNINEHHNEIKRQFNGKLIAEEEEGLINPEKKKIFVPQRFQYIRYRKKQKFNFLGSPFWEKQESFKDISSFLLNELIRVENSFNPIVILGDPGAGKSMLTQLFAGRLLESDYFVPFFIRLRDVIVDSTEPNKHINEGIKETLLGRGDVDWVKWCREFPDRCPVIVLDGYDELVQASEKGLNHYLKNIANLQEKLFENNGIVARVILTSRKSVMQEVEIPEGTTIIHLDKFDHQQKALWISTWNGIQRFSDEKLFRLPVVSQIQELASEPLLLFLLAVYDAKTNELNRLTELDTYNRAKLYDKILTQFASRQLSKNKLIKEANPETKKQKELLFRLQLGYVAIHMFLTGYTYKKGDSLEEELALFGLEEEGVKAQDLFSGFFFIHTSTAKDSESIERNTYEFLHKSFGEFLAADFLLYIVKEQFKEVPEFKNLASLEALRFAWSNSWLHKQPNVANFLFDHVDSIEENKEKVLELIKKELKGIFESNISHSSISEKSILGIKPKPLLDQLAIYSQNMIFLWVALDGKIAFPFRIDESIHSYKRGGYPFDHQDRNEADPNKRSWKKLCLLWKTVGNDQVVAAIKGWVKVEEDSNAFYLQKADIPIVKYNHTDSTEVAGNDYERLLSMFYTEVKAEKLIKIYRQKPELLPLILQVILLRLEDFLDHPPSDLISFLSLINRDELDDKYKNLTVFLAFKVSSLLPFDNELFWILVGGESLHQGNFSFPIKESNPINHFFHRESGLDWSPESEMYELQELSYCSAFLMIRKLLINYKEIDNFSEYYIQLFWEFIGKLIRDPNDRYIRAIPSILESGIRRLDLKLSDVTLGVSPKEFDFLLGRCSKIEDFRKFSFDFHLAQIKLNLLDDDYTYTDPVLFFKELAVFLDAFHELELEREEFSIVIKNTIHYFLLYSVLFEDCPYNKANIIEKMAKILSSYNKFPSDHTDILCLLSEFYFIADKPLKDTIKLYMVKTSVDFDISILSYDSAKLLRYTYIQSRIDFKIFTMEKSSLEDLWRKILIQEPGRLMNIDPFLIAKLVATHLPGCWRKTKAILKINGGINDWREPNNNFFENHYLFTGKHYHQLNLEKKLPEPTLQESILYQKYSWENDTVYSNVVPY